jgi:hypothetical protein
MYSKMKPSKSPERHTFQKEKYIERQMEADEPVSEDYLKMFDMIDERERTKWDDPESRKDNLEWDLVTTDWILEKCCASEAYAQNLYAALCNNGFIKLAVIPILKNEEWSCSWRYAGGIIADMRQQGDYIDWYCSGIRDTFHNNDDTKDFTEEQLARLEITKRYVGEGCITDEIRNDLQRLGWAVAPGGDWENFK